MCSLPGSAADEACVVDSIEHLWGNGAKRRIRGRAHSFEPCETLIRIIRLAAVVLAADDGNILLFPVARMHNE